MENSIRNQDVGVAMLIAIVVVTASRLSLAESWEIYVCILTQYLSLLLYLYIFLNFYLLIF